MSECAAIAPAAGLDADGVGCRYPSAWRHGEGVASGLTHKRVEFDTFKIRVVELFPGDSSPYYSIMLVFQSDTSSQA